MAKDFKFIGALNMAKRKPPPQLIGEIVPLGSFAVLVGAPGIGKSFLALAMGLCVATGKQCLGRSIMHPGPVVYVTAEGTGGVPLRIQAWLTHRKVKGSVPLKFLCHEVNLSAPAEVATLLTAIGALKEKPVLVVFDTLARCLPGGDENTSKDMGKLVTQVDHIRRETGSAVLLVHHPDKTKRHERGSTSLRGAADTMMFLDSNLKLGLHLRCAKQKEDEPFEPIKVELHKVTLDDGMSSCVVRRRKAPPQSAEVALSTQHKKALQVLKSIKGGASFKDWKAAAEEAKVPTSTFTAARKALVNSGLVIETGGKYLPAPAIAKKV